MRVLHAAHQRLIDMRPIPDSCTVVLVGSWNTRLLNISWISQHLFEGEDVTGEFSLVPGLPDRFSADGIRILPGEDRLIIGPTKFTDELLKGVEDKTVRILKLLQYTPLRAVGMNYVFTDIEPVTAFEEMFACAERDPLIKSLGEPDKIVIQRSFPYDGGTVNIAVGREDTDTRISFNYNWQVAVPSEAINILEGKVITMKEHALETVSGSYALTMEEED
ncbi:MAG: hypothetical protein ACYC6A_15170 [Armatimonadota bacterium]